MLQKFLFTLSIILTIGAFNLGVAAQGNETFAVRDSKLAAVNLPNGAQRVRDASVPEEIKTTLAKLVAAGGSIVRQGDSEVVVWQGNYKKANGAQMVANLEGVLRNSGWEYEIGEKNNDFVVFSLFRAEPVRRALVGFFVPSEDAFILALTEMLPSGAAVNETGNQSDEPSNSPSTSGSFNAGSSQGIVGKWSRGEGSGHIDYTGKTRYKSGITYTFEFFPDGTVAYSSDKDVLAIIQCTIKATEKARGKYTINGDMMTINLGSGTSVSASTCDKKDNYNRTLPASTITKKFTVKRMESLARPDRPWILCFDGQEGDGCFERESK